MVLFDFSMTFVCDAYDYGGSNKQRPTQILFYFNIIDIGI